MKGLITAVIALAVVAALAAGAYQHYSVQPLMPAKPSPFQQASPSPQPQAVIALNTATSTPSPQLLPRQGLVSFPEPNNNIQAIIPAPERQQVMVLTGNGDDEPYSLKINLVDLSAKVPTVTVVVAGSNAVDFTKPVWSADSKHIYYAFDNGCYGDRGPCGIYDYDVDIGKSRRLIDRPTVGLAVSPDNQLLAFWDYTLGDVLTVYSIPRKEVLRRWQNQPHTAGEFLLRDMAFPPDSKSLLATTSEERRWPLREFELENGDIRTVSRDTISGPVSTSRGVYFVEGHPYQEDTTGRKLMTVSHTGARPESVSTEFPYSSLQPAGDPRWISVWRTREGTLLYDTQAGSKRAAGPDCWQAAILSDGRAVYGFHGALVEDTKVCGTPAVETASF